MVAHQHNSNTVIPTAGRVDLYTRGVVATGNDSTGEQVPQRGGARMGRLPRIFLASRSPRRRLLLTEHGIEHDAEHPGLEDSGLEPGRVSAEQWVAALAYLKAAAGLQVYRAAPGRYGPLLLGADTVCVRDGRLIGTPEDAEEAAAMIRGMRDGAHDVVTGVALIEAETGRRHLFVDRASVRVGHIPDSAIDAYIASGDWRGKAGGYNLRERIDAGWPIEFDGDATTIMGLPMAALGRALGRLYAA